MKAKLVTIDRYLSSSDEPDEKGWHCWIRVWNIVNRATSDSQQSPIASRYADAQITISLDVNNEVDIKDNLITADRRFDESPDTVRAYIELMNKALSVAKDLEAGKPVVTTAMQERYDSRLVAVDQLEPGNRVVSWPSPDYVIAGSMLPPFTPMEVIESVPIKVDWFYLTHDLVYIADEVGTIDYLDLDEDTQHRLGNSGVDQIPSLHNLDTDAYLVKLTNPNDPAGHGITYVIDLNDRIMPDDILYKRWSLA